MKNPRDADLRSREARWFWIPGLFGVLLLISLALRWLPAALSTAHTPGGVAQVIAGDFILAWKSFLRAAVAYVLTALALDWLPAIRWRTVWIISVIALLGEVAAESITGAVVGVHAGLIVQLIATTLAYGAMLFASISIIENQSRAIV
jgi:hypothetical protein